MSARYDVMICFFKRERIRLGHEVLKSISLVPLGAALSTVGTPTNTNTKGVTQKTKTNKRRSPDTFDPSHHHLQRDRSSLRLQRAFLPSNQLFLKAWQERDRSSGERPLC